MIYTVGLGFGIDEPLLRRIATGTGGRYFSAPSARIWSRRLRRSAK